MSIEFNDVLKVVLYLSVIVVMLFALLFAVSGWIVLMSVSPFLGLGLGFIFIIVFALIVKGVNK